jgi:hypothetical protein
LGCILALLEIPLAGKKHFLRPISPAILALQLPFCFEMRTLSGGLVSSTPKRPCDDVCGLYPLSSEPDGDATDFLD